MEKFIIKSTIKVFQLADLEVIGETDKTGTKIHFVPDPEIFTETVEFEYDVLASEHKSLPF